MRVPTEAREFSGGVHCLLVLEYSILWWVVGNGDEFFVGKGVCRGKLEGFKLIGVGEPLTKREGARKPEASWTGP